MFILFDLILYVPVNNLSVICGDRSSWVKPVLSKDKCVLLKDTTQSKHMFKLMGKKIITILSSKSFLVWAYEFAQDFL